MLHTTYAKLLYKTHLHAEKVLYYTLHLFQDNTLTPSLDLFQGSTLSLFLLTVFSFTSKLCSAELFYASTFFKNCEYNFI